jgi:hypothetical protein
MGADGPESPAPTPSHLKPMLEPWQAEGGAAGLAFGAPWPDRGLGGERPRRCGRSPAQLFNRHGGSGARRYEVTAQGCWGL